jgi:hypothetical protein
MRNTPPRCPVCNQYLPDRCICNGSSKEQQLGRVKPLGTGRRQSAPARQTVTNSAVQAAAARMLIDVDFDGLELKVLNGGWVTHHRPKIIQRYDSPAGPYAGRVEVWDGDKHIVTFSLSGNARQRRRTIRQLKVDFTVRQTNDATGAIITR